MFKITNSVVLVYIQVVLSSVWLVRDKGDRVRFAVPGHSMLQGKKTVDSANATGNLQLSVRWNGCVFQLAIFQLTIESWDE